MPAGRYSFTIEQGSTISFEFQYKDSSGIPIDLTGYSGRMQIRPTVDSSTVYLSLSSSLNSDGTGLNFSGSNGTTPPTSGSIGLYIASCTSSMLNFDQAVYDLELYTSASGCPYVTRILEGQIKLSKEVTR
jgi:hypothetical protein